jgi:uncharacterized membrane protein YcaP (DUF421 family)
LIAVFWHTVVIYVFLIAGLSLLARRQIAQLTSVELVVVMVLGSAVETAMVAGNLSLAAGLVSASTLLVSDRLLSLGLRRWRGLRRAIVGGPLVLVHNGRLIPEHIRRAGLTEALVLQGLRERGYDHLEEVRFGVLEIDGSISVIPRDAPPPTNLPPSVEA